MDNPLLGPFRTIAALRDALAIRQFGETMRTARTPYDVVARDPVHRLRRYTDDKATSKQRPPILLVPPLMLAADVYDIAREGSAVAALLARGIDPWVVDFGAPERQEGGTRRTLTDHVLAVSKAVDRVVDQTGTEVHLAGYSQGGMFCYQTAAYRQSGGLASVITFGSPVDARREMIPGVPDDIAGHLIEALAPALIQPFSTSALPAWVSRNAFKMLSPMKEVRAQLEFFTNLYGRKTKRHNEGQRRFLAEEGWVAWPGPALRDFVEQFLIENRLRSGGFVIEGNTLTLADITCPILTFVGETDDIARPGGVRAIREAAPRAETFEVMLRAGHFGLVVGSRAMKSTWPTVARWVHWREGQGRRPAAIRSAKAVDDASPPDEAPGAEAVWDLVRDVAQGIGSAIGGSARGARDLLTNMARQFPLISRLVGIRRDTRIGLSLTLSEQAENNPEGTFFLFGGRAYTYADADRRVDAVARGLLSVGVRQGEHVGIYMSSRPSALALTTAVNRLGAVAVLLRPDGPLEIEAELGAIGHIIADPEHAEKARDTLGRKILVLGGGGEPRQLAHDLIDMEAIDPDRVVVPEWYRASPGRAEEVAFVLFAGSGDRAVANRITNRRWAQSAFGTASAADMTSADGVYCWTPIHHPTGLLVSISSALVSGARLALADGFSAERFWGEVRRYGASIVFYTGTICRELVDAPPDAAEHGHPVRLFAGSGMPGPIWQRLLDRFGPVGVLEFYASTQGNAILANVSGEKIGSAGRPLPGSAEVAVASYDPIARELLKDEAGYCIAARNGEVGLLLARLDVHRGAIEGSPMRSVFEAGDAWYATDQLFRQDADGDLFLLDHLADVIRHHGMAVPSIAIEAAAWQLDQVSAAAAYGIALDDTDNEVVALAIVLRPNTRLAPAELLDAFRHEVAAENYPRIVRLVDEIPMTQGYRFRKQPLRDRGLPDGTQADGKAYWYDAESRCYRRIDAKAAAGLRTALASPTVRRRPAAKRPRRTRGAVGKT